VVGVLPDVPALRRRFDYLVPAPLDDRVQLGTQVRIPLHGRRVGGWVVADGELPPHDVTLRPLAAVRGWGPPPAVLDLATWAAWRWAGAEAHLLRTASSDRAVRSLPPPPPAPPRTPTTTPATMPPTPPSIPGFVDDVGAGECAVLRLPPTRDPGPVVEDVARRGLAAGHGALVLVPARRQAEVLAVRLRRAGLPVAVLPEQWAAARAGGCVAVGTRAAALAPLPDLGAAVVVDAHDQAYHQEQAPTWTAWEVVVERARRAGAPCVLTSSCPTLEVLGAGRLVVLSRAEERAGWPRIEVVDRRRDDPRTGLWSAPVVEAVRRAASEPGRRVVCIVNRTGRVRVLACASCGELARCEQCSGPLEQVEGEDSSPPALRCRRCGTTRPLVCAACGSARFKALRIGVRRVREELEALTGSPVVEVSATSGPDDDASDGDAARGVALVVGTEAALHRVRGADTVVFLDFDDELLAPRLRAGEDAMALLARAARLVGRPGPVGGRDHGSGRAPGRIVVQTRQPGHDVLRAAVLADPGRLAASELQVRRALRLPPVTAAARVSGAGADEYGAALRLATSGTEVSVSGPLDGVWLVQGPDHRALCDALAGVARPAGRLRVEVDPVRL
jgi:primosomal protein N' (replication factor Y)